MGSEGNNLKFDGFVFKRADGEQKYVPASSQEGCRILCSGISGVYKDKEAD
jgi:hypothetical protein